MAAAVFWVPAGGGAEKSFFFELTRAETHTYEQDVTEHPVERGFNVTDHVRPVPVKVDIEVVQSQTPLYSDRISQGAVPITVNTRAYSPVNKKLAVDPYFPPALSGPANLVGAAVRGIGDAIFGPKVYSADLLEGTDATAKHVALLDKHAAFYDYVGNAIKILDKLRDDSQLVTLVTSNKLYRNMVLVSNTWRREGPKGLVVFSLSFRHIRIVDTKQGKVPKAAEVRAVPVKNKGAQGATAKEIAQSILSKTTGVGVARAVP